MFGHDDDNDEATNDQVTVTPTEDTGADTGVGPSPAPAAVDTPADEPLLTATTKPDDSAVASSEDADLLALKKQALEELSPLVDHLEQTPEEKFKTTMMMIQATDSSNLLKVAYESAQNIEDEKVRAQALLDIVNEINYFTQK
jgi:hypothetical protein